MSESAATPLSLAILKQLRQEGHLDECKGVIEEEEANDQVCQIIDATVAIDRQARFNSEMELTDQVGLICGRLKEAVAERQQLEEIRRTLLVNFGPENGRSRHRLKNPIDPDQGTLYLMVTIMEQLIEKPKGTSDEDQS